MRTVYSLSVALIVIIVYITGKAIGASEAREKDYQTQTIVESVNSVNNGYQGIPLFKIPKEYQVVYETNSEPESDFSVDTLIKEENMRPKIDNIPLSDELLDYIYDLSVEKNIPYTLMLAIMAVESGFDPATVSKTNDYGLAQINGINIKNFAKAAGIKNVNPLDPEHNVQMQAYYLEYLKNKWSEEKYGFSEEQKFFMVVLAYNRGEGGALKWIKTKGWKNSYVDKVAKVKEELEQNTYGKKVDS